jgi:hypothetical protein
MPRQVLPTLDRGGVFFLTSPFIGHSDNACQDQSQSKSSYNVANGREVLTFVPSSRPSLGEESLRTPVEPHFLIVWDYLDAVPAIMAHSLEKSDTGSRMHSVRSLAKPRKYLQQRRMQSRYSRS